MDGAPPPVAVPPDPDDPARYSVSFCRDATAPENYLSGSPSADTANASQSGSSVTDESAMDTSAVTVPSDTNVSTALDTLISSVADVGADVAMEQQPSEVPPSDTPGGSRARRTPSPTPTDSSLPSSSAHRSLSSQDLSAGGEELRSMTASMEQLAMVDPPPVQRRVTRAASPSAPLAKTQRSSSGRRRAPANYAAAAAERRSPPPANPIRGSMRGRAKATARPGPSTSRSGPSQPPARGAASSRASRGRGRSAARTSAGSLPQVDTSQLPEETPKGFSHYLIHRHPWARFVNPRPIRMVRDNPPQVHNNLNTEGYRHLPDCGYMSLRFQ
ncbi:hypothetical protein OSTOST_22182 [Ostertagia ostertagi]